MSEISQDALNQIFIDAHTHYKWFDKDVPDETLEKLYHLLALCPTSANCSPARITFLRSTEAKERLKPYLMETNVPQTMAAPVVAIVGYDLEFYEKLPYLFPFTDAKSWFTGNEEFARKTAILNGSLQGGYMIMAARSLGLDCGPMSGFDHEGVNDEFFKDSPVRVNFICNLGYGDPEGLPGPRAPRLAFDQACKVL